MRLKGKTAIITGAGSGMGAAEARLFAAEGAKVMLTDINEANLRAVASEIGDNAIWLRHDVSDEAGWTEVVDKTIAAFGTVDILLNNAGINCDGKIQDIESALMRKSLEINLLGAFYGMKSVIEPMRKNGGGSIINISSGLGTTSAPGFVAYGVAKWGIRGLTRLSAKDLAEHNIRVNTLFPGAIETPLLVSAVREKQATMMPMKRVGSAEEFAQVALFVASDAASYVSGAEIMVDGALLC